MRILYLDTSMGAAGDMLTSALLELFDNKEELVDKLNNFGLKNVKFEIIETKKSGINGTRSIVKIKGEEEEVYDFDIKNDEIKKEDHNCNDKKCNHHHHHEHTHDHNDNHKHCHKHEHDNTHQHYHNHEHDHGHSHLHRGLKEISEIVNGLNIKENIKKDIMSVYKLIAEAESKSHKIDVSEIHFHEVGALDAIADISAVCFLIDELKVDKIISSPINLGSGHVRCAHGILPVPAPATAYILKDVPIYSGKIKSELCTPTGAALLKYFVDEFTEIPTLNIKKIGYGMGKKDFEVLNAVRSFLAEDTSLNDKVYELSCNVDDMTGEEISFAMDRFFHAKAREVYIIPIIMKKSRPGHLIRVMCGQKEKENLIKLIFKHTTTIGIREVETKRYILDRKIEEIESEFGKIDLKKSAGYEVERKKFEYDDLEKIAEENNLSIFELKEKLKDN